MFGWWKRKREERERIDREAQAFLHRFGDQAYDLALARAVEAMRVNDHDGNRYWTLVRAHIRRFKDLPPHVDTATRYVEEPL